MPDDRPKIPAALKRELLVEAGHRCAIPTCRQATPLQFDHIEDWAKVRKHEFANMIVLCANCHARKTAGDIDRKSMHLYKANLSVLNNRYGDLEKRVLDLFAASPEAGFIELQGGLDLHLWYLLKDGLLQKINRGGGNIVIMGIPALETYQLTARGREFVSKWMSARPVDGAELELDEY
ncbi:HNH endonuclease [Amycolatopsis sp. cmx-4-68]|uniref:HNH endonuclease n=1 Tax=Amycolatopsis sp. cmx-4-68 TaxID=2790938 RepID=UPI00397C5CA2